MHGKVGPRSGAGSSRGPRVYVLDEFTYPIKWGWVDVHEVVDVLARREGGQHVSSRAGTPRRS